MRVKVQSQEATENFIPFSVTFFITNEEEAERFHDDVAIGSITPHQCDFIGNVYRRCDGVPVEDFEGEI